MKYLDLLGYTVADRVSGYTGVVESISYDLYGCIQAVVRPPVNEKNEIPEGRYLDCKRLSILPRSERVMPVPEFYQELILEAGAAEKPGRR